MYVTTHSQLGKCGCDAKVLTHCLNSFCFVFHWLYGTLFLCDGVSEVLYGFHKVHMDIFVVV